jgi:hypothetical protein
MYRCTLPGRLPVGHPGLEKLAARQAWFFGGDTPNEARKNFRAALGKKLKLRADEQIDVQVGEADDAPLAKSKPVPTKTTTHDDSAFVRTALVVGSAGDGGGSVDVVTADGQRVCQINVSVFFGKNACADRGAGVIVDVVDVDGLFRNRRALAFPVLGAPAVEVEAGAIVSADFWEKPAKKIAKRDAWSTLPEEERDALATIIYEAVRYGSPLNTEELASFVRHLVDQQGETRLPTFYAGSEEFQLACVAKAAKRRGCAQCWVVPRGRRGAR